MPLVRRYWVSLSQDAVVQTTAGPDPELAA